jgi:putative ABC transport system permease protein
MGVPIAYNFRNLVVRRTTTVLTALGIALPVAVLLASMALMNGVEATLGSSGDPLNILVLRKGSSTELSSTITPGIFREMLYRPGIARSAESGRPLASLELTTVVKLPAGSGAASVTLRGLLPAGIELRNATLRGGQWFRAGQRELVVGRSIAERCPDAQIGGSLRFGRRAWRVVGVMDGGMDGGRSTVSSEIFGDLNQVSSDFNRAESLSSVQIRATDAVAVQALINSLNDDQRLNAFAQTERDYYARQSTAAEPIRNVFLFVSIIMAAGSSFAAMNTMYAVVDRRTREIGTLRVLGFSRGSILWSFLMESLLLAAAGAIAACLMVLPLNTVTTAIGNSATMSELAVSFRVSPWIMLGGILYAMVLGLISGALPARTAASKEILAALREG